MHSQCFQCQHKSAPSFHQTLLIGKQCRLCFQLVNFPSRALNIKIILQWPSFRISEHRVRVSALQEIVARRHLKIVFFGRTSSGKSSAINALLGDKILPTGESETDSSMYLRLFFCTLLKKLSHEKTQKIGSKKKTQPNFAPKLNLPQAFLY